MFKKILIPLDGSKLSEVVIPYAEALAKLFDSEVTLLFVCETPGCQQHYEHQVYIEKTAGQMTKNIGDEGAKTPVKPVLLVGNPALEIVNYATENDIRLVVMSTHGRSGIMSWAMGSTADRVIDRIDTPALLIRANTPSPEADREELFRRILLPLDGSEAGEAALPHIKELTGKVASEVILFQVATEGKHVHTVGGLNYVRFERHILDSIKAKGAEYLNRVASRLEGTQAKVRCELKTGDTAKEIIDFADEIDASLVAMSTHGHSGIERWAFGSIAHRVLHHGHTHLLLVRSQAPKH